MLIHRLRATVRMIMSGTIMILALATSTAMAREVGPVYTLHVDGLACPFCAYGIEKQLSKIKGVKKIDIDVSAGAVTITMAVGTRLDEPTARQAVEAAAFSLRDFLQVQPAGQRQRKE